MDGEPHDGALVSDREEEMLSFTKPRLVYTVTTNFQLTYFWKLVSFRALMFKHMGPKEGENKSQVHLSDTKKKLHLSERLSSGEQIVFHKRTLVIWGYFMGLKYSVILSVLDPRKCEYLNDYSLDFEHAYMTTYLAS